MKNIIEYINKKYDFLFNIRDIKKINSSTNNSVYDLGKYILKISKNKYNLKNEFNVLNILYGNILCPKPILYDKYDRKYLLIIEKINGKTLDYYWNDFNPQEKENTINEIINNMKIINSISGKYFQDYIGGNEIKSHSYYNILEQKLDIIKEKAFENKDVTKSKLNKYIKYFNDNKATFENEIPSLVHNDMWYKNIIYDINGKIHIIDFETAVYAPKQVEMFGIYNHFMCAKNYLEEDPTDYKEYSFLEDFISIIQSNYPELKNYNPKQETIRNIIRYFNMLTKFNESRYDYKEIKNFEANLLLN